MPTARIPVYELQIGMHVVKLDVSWFRSPFLRHSFVVQDPAQIDKLVRAGIRTVHIETPAPPADEPSRRGMNETSPASRPAALITALPSQRKTLARLNEEYAQAKLARKQLEQAVEAVFTGIQERGTVDADQASVAVREILIAARTLSASAIFMALTQNGSGDSTLTQHALSVSTIALVLGQAVEMNPLELHQLATAALLHDIGLLHTPPDILRRSRVTSTPLTPAEQKAFQNHPRRSLLMLEERGGFDTAVLHMIAEHHAYLDGSGYPPERRGEFTSVQTRILMLADKYDEFLTGFGGASPLAPYQTLQRLYQEAQDGVLDLGSVSTLIKIVGIFHVHSEVRLNTGERAVVMALNQTRLHQPVIAVTHDAAGTPLVSPFVVDLASQGGGASARAIETIFETNPASLLSRPRQGV
jgi:putative nucleotidyltransferase with HDIG domain